MRGFVISSLEKGSGRICGGGIETARGKARSTSLATSNTPERFCSAM